MADKCKYFDTPDAQNEVIEGTTPVAHFDKNSSLQPTPGDHDGKYGDPYTYKFTYRCSRMGDVWDNVQLGSGNNGDGANVQPY